MVLIVIVEKSGVLKELNIKQYDNEYLCKKAGFKSSKDFKAQTCWKQENIEVYLYGKSEGRAGQENKYDMPPPVDNTLFFGSCLLIMKEKNKEVDLSVKTWKEIYENLFGGFEDIGNEDSEEEKDEDDEDADLPQTKEGYAKDGFVVADDEDAEDEDEDADEDADEDDDVVDDVEDDDVVDDVEDDDEDEDEDEDTNDEDEPSPVKRVQPKRRAKKSENNVFISIQNALEDEFLNCDSELSEEEYV